MILQLLFDDKFTDYVIDQFHEYREAVRTVLVKNSSSEKVIYSRKAEQIESVCIGSAEYEEIENTIGLYSGVIMHGLFAEWQYDLVRKLPEHVKLAWVLWGAEVYDRPEYIKNHLTCSSRMLLFLHDLKQRVCHKEVSSCVPMDVLSRVDYCLESSEEIFNEVNAAIGGHLQNMPYSYYTLEQLVGEDVMGKISRGNNIFLGNSATITNNHINLFRRLFFTHFPKDAKLFVPLSYGAPWVRNIVVKTGRFLLGKSFAPLLDFMPRNEYNALLLSCSSYMTNHHRPNAFGNVLTCLWVGVRVWSSKWNAQTQYLKRLGLTINVIEDDLKKHPELLACGLTESEILSNRLILRQEFGTEALDMKVRNIIAVLS